MKKFAKGVVKWIVSYAVVVLFIMFLPVFLLTSDFSGFDSMMNYLFNNK